MRLSGRKTRIRGLFRRSVSGVCSGKEEQFQYHFISINWCNSKFKDLAARHHLVLPDKFVGQCWSSRWDRADFDKPPKGSTVWFWSFLRFFLSGFLDVTISRSSNSCTKSYLQGKTPPPRWTTARHHCQQHLPPTDRKRKSAATVLMSALTTDVAPHVQ